LLSRHTGGVDLATWQLIEHTSETLVRLLQAHVDASMPTGNVLVQNATAGSFTDLRSTARPVITVFLYRVVENTEQRNAPPKRRPDGSVVRQPMVVELCYLITPWGARLTTAPDVDAAAAFEEHRLLGLVLQAFYDHAEIGRSELFEDPDPTQPRVWGPVDSIQLVHETLPIEDLYRIWDASELSYRLSATYRARVLGLESATAQATSPVVDADVRVGGMT
jgi:hypothetical protein